MSIQKGSLLDYLPPQQKQRVLMLVHRLQEQTQQKNKYLTLYTEIKQEYESLLKNYTKLKDENEYLKKQIHNSFSIVSQVRANFHATKPKSSTKLKKQQDQEWEDEENYEEQNKQYTANQIDNTTKMPRQTYASPLQKYRPPMTSKKDKQMKIINLSNSELNQSQILTGKSKQVQKLRMEVKALQQQKKKKQNAQKQYKDKHRLVQQIKQRYKSGSKNEMKLSTISNEIQQQDNTSFLQDLRANRSQKDMTPQKKKSSKKEENSVNKPQLLKKAEFSKNSTSKPQKCVVTSQDYGDILDLINGYSL